MCVHSEQMRTFAQVWSLQMSKTQTGPYILSFQSLVYDVERARPRTVGHQEQEASWSLSTMLGERTKGQSQRPSAIPGPGESHPGVVLKTSTGEEIVLSDVPLLFFQYVPTSFGPAEFIKLGLLLRLVSFPSWEGLKPLYSLYSLFLLFPRVPTLTT